MAAGLRGEEAEAAEKFEADLLLTAGEARRIFHHLAQFGIEVVPLKIGEFQEKGLMVDAHAARDDLLGLPPHEGGQGPVGGLHPVAEPVDFYVPAAAIQSDGIHGHGVDVVEPDGPRADPFGGVRHLEERLQYTEPPEDAAGAEGVPHHLLHAVLPGDLVLQTLRRRRPRPDNGDDVLRPRKSLFQIRGGGDLRLGSEFFHQDLHQRHGVAEPFGGNIHQRDLAPGAQVAVQQEILEEIEGKTDASRADHSYLEHFFFPYFASFRTRS